MHFIFIHELVCLSLVCHSCTFGILALSYSCTITVPLSHYYCHALLNMSPYCYLIHGTKYFRGGLNISYSVLKYPVRGDQIFCPGGQNWGGPNFSWQLSPSIKIIVWIQCDIHAVPQFKESSQSLLHLSAPCWVIIAIATEIFSLTSTDFWDGIRLWSTEWKPV